MDKLDLRSATKDTKHDIRKRAIRLIEKGVNKAEIARLLGVNRNSVNTWHRKYKADGSQGLHEKNRGVTKGSGSLLTATQARQIQDMITDKMPDQLKLPYGLWTRSSVKALIKREFGIDIAIRTMGTYLNSWGFTPQKPKKRAYEQCDKAVQQWLRVEYPKIQRQAKQQGAEIHWGDETGVKNGCQHGRSYAPQGKTPVKTETAKRVSLNMISTVTNQGKVRFMLYKDSLDANRLIKFLQRLIKPSKQKIYLILDNLRVHHSHKVRDWVDKNKDKIALFFLPSYSPELNPDEYLNCDLKYGLSEKGAAKDDNELRKNINSHMRKLQNRPERVRKYFLHSAIKYAA